ncbi:putative ribonuclease H protein [Glycine soja]
MLVSWNIRGLNKAGKLREISSHLLNLQPSIVVLIETRVKEANAHKIRGKLGLKGKYLDNYSQYGNGTLWIFWDDSKLELRYVRSSCQLIHCSVHDVAGKFKFWLTTIYAHNQLDNRKKLWLELDDIYKNQQGPWCAVGDYNNVLNSMDKIGGQLVIEAEFKDLRAMMENIGLCEMDSSSEFFTWSNKQAFAPIYSRIDRILANVEWLQDHVGASLDILPAHISDHALLHLHFPDSVKKHKLFRFHNGWTNVLGFQDIVDKSWSKDVKGLPMQRLWKKLMRLKNELLTLNRKSDIQKKVQSARIDLAEAFVELRTNQTEASRINKVKEKTESLIYWNEMEERDLMQRAKIDWISLGDGNTKFFHAYLKTKQKSTTMKMLQKLDGSVITNHANIAQEVIEGDTVSMEMMIKTVTEFSNTTGLVINPTKCRIYFGGINSVDKASFQSVAPFCEGQLPFRYLGVPLTDKKLNIKYYLPLIDKVLARVNHWTSRLLTAASRLQLVRCTISAVVQFWMQCLPLPKSVINKIDSICRRFVWSGGTEGKKNPVAWTTVCRPRKLGGLDVLNLHVWNQITLLKCLWNICKKTDNLWVKWVHIHYMKGKELLGDTYSIGTVLDLALLI